VLAAGRRVDRVNGWVKKNGSSPRTRTARRGGTRQTRGMERNKVRIEVVRRGV